MDGRTDCSYMFIRYVHGQRNKPKQCALRKKVVCRFKYRAAPEEMLSLLCASSSIGRSVKSALSLLIRFEYASFSRRLFSAIMCKHDVSYKPDIHNISQRCQRKTEQHATKIWRSLDMWLLRYAGRQTDRQTDRHTHTHTLITIPRSSPSAVRHSMLESLLSLKKLGKKKTAIRSTMEKICGLTPIYR